ncbi:hypothetical protein [Sporomusa aerivorans]|uniref:hypothetical protein n=1 Tax=Sporomusa aerivorans TaxID=204936 RepID=UPI003529F793
MNKLKMIVDSNPSSVLSQSNGSYWIPIIQLKADIWVGISSEGYWIVESRGIFGDLSTLASYWRVFVLLELPLSEVRRQVKNSFISLNVDEDIDDIFPFIEIIKAAFEVGTSYWAELAFNWYDELRYEKREALKGSLIKIVEHKKGSRKFRHKAMKELKRICPKA